MYMVILDCIIILNKYIHKYGKVYTYHVYNIIVQYYDGKYTVYVHEH